jgi:YD repeat-containing protein
LDASNLRKKSKHFKSDYNYASFIVVKIPLLMKKNLSLFIVSLLMMASVCKAQAPMPQYHLKAAPVNIVIDGSVKEWGDSLSYYSPEERVNYAISNSKDTLYLAVKIYDRSEIMRVLNAGLTFIVDPKGKKKETYSLTYPLNVQGGTAIPFNHTPGENENVSPEERNELLQERMTKLRGIKVVGFKEVEDEMITTSNTYGIQTAVNYDDAGNLIYEEAIPMKFFHGDDKAEWAFNIRINGVQRPKPTDDGGNGGGHSGGMGGGGGGRHGGGGHGGGSRPSLGENSEMSKSLDFWGKFYLAK